MLEKKKKHKNTVKLKYQTLLEENLKKAEKITELQDKVIRLEEVMLQQKEKIIELLESPKNKEVKEKK